MTLFRQIKGLIPALDPKKITDLHIIAGRNFLVDADGPYAAFGSDLITKEQIKNPQFADTFRVGSDIFLMTQDEVLAFDKTSQFFYPRFIFSSSLTADFPWSRAIVGGLHYFAKKNSLLIEYNPTTNAWREISNEVTADVVYGVTESGGRLIVVTRNMSVWSAISDGANLDITQIDKGIGAQFLSKIGGGEPLGVFRTFDGFITYTKSGLMKSQLIDTLITFRHDRLTGDDDDSEFIPISPYCIIKFGRNSHLLLSRTGFYITTGGIPEQYQPLLSEYFRRKVLNLFDLTIDGTIKLTYNSDKQWTFISISDLQRKFEFNRAFVIYKPVDEPGIFNRLHVGFGELSFTDGPFKGFNFGFFCPSGCLHRFNDFPQIENHPDGLTGTALPEDTYFHHEVLDVNSRIENNITIMTSSINFTTVDPALFTLGSGLYTYRLTQEFLNPQTVIDIVEPAAVGLPTIYRSSMQFQAGYALSAWSQTIITYASIDSFIDIGLFQPISEVPLDVDIATLVTDVAIGALDQPSSVIVEDWAEPVDVSITEDWAALTGNQDWGNAIFETNIYKAKITGTIDGKNQFQDQQQDLEERSDIVDAALMETTGKTRYFTCYNTGLQHIIKIEALEVQQSYHVKTVDLLLIPVGRI